MNPKLFNARAPALRMAVTTVSGGTSVSVPDGASVRIVNHGPNHAHISIGNGPQTALVPSASQSRSCCTVLANSDVTLGITNNGDPLQIAARTETGTATLDVAISNGM